MSFSFFYGIAAAVLFSILASVSMILSIPSSMIRMGINSWKNYQNGNITLRRFIWDILPIPLQIGFISLSPPNNLTIHCTDHWQSMIISPTVFSAVAVNHGMVALGKAFLAGISGLARKFIPWGQQTSLRRTLFNQGLVNQGLDPNNNPLMNLIPMPPAAVRIPQPIVRFIPLSQEEIEAYISCSDHNQAQLAAYQDYMCVDGATCALTLTAYSDREADYDWVTVTTTNIANKTTASHSFIRDSLVQGIEANTSIGRAGINPLNRVPLVGDAAHNVVIKSGFPQSIEDFAKQVRLRLAEQSTHKCQLKTNAQENTTALKENLVASVPSQVAAGIDRFDTSMPSFFANHTTDSNRPNKFNNTFNQTT